MQITISCNLSSIDAIILCKFVSGDSNLSITRNKANKLLLLIAENKQFYAYRGSELKVNFLNWRNVAIIFNN